MKMSKDEKIIILPRTAMPVKMYIGNDFRETFLGLNRDVFAYMEMRLGELSVRTWRLDDATSSVVLRAEKEPYDEAPMITELKRKEN